MRPASTSAANATTPGWELGPSTAKAWVASYNFSNSGSGPCRLSGTCGSAQNTVWTSANKYVCACVLVYVYVSLLCVCVCVRVSVSVCVCAWKLTQSFTYAWTTSCYTLLIIPKHHPAVIIIAKNILIMVIAVRHHPTF